MGFAGAGDLGFAALDGSADLVFAGADFFGTGAAVLGLMAGFFPELAGWAALAAFPAGLTALAGLEEFAGLVDRDFVAAFKERSRLNGRAEKIVELAAEVKDLFLQGERLVGIKAGLAQSRLQNFLFFAEFCGG